MEYYVKVKSTCDNCAFQCGIQLDPHEEPRWYCNKSGCKKELPKENTCKNFCFDSNILRPTVESKDVLIKEEAE